MTTEVERLADGRLRVASLDGLSTADAMNLFLGFKVQHTVWLTPLDTGLVTFAGNFGISYQEGDGLLTRTVDSCYILVIG
jgi:hypothetical protein